MNVDVFYFSDMSADFRITCSIGKRMVRFGIGREIIIIMIDVDMMMRRKSLSG